MGEKAGSNEALKKRLEKDQEIDIRVTGRKSGRSISNPVWFVYEGDKLYLVPVKGSETQWYKNVRQNPAMQIRVHEAAASVRAVPISDAAQVSTIVEKFREKYGAADVKKYYSKFDVAVVITV
jgi:deazaflavin-dependent oxidoreductase (nitroreductase family)